MANTHIPHFTYFEQEQVNRAREFLRGKILVNKLSKETIPQNGKLKFCINHRDEPHVFGEILSGRHDRLEAVDKPGWIDGKCVNVHQYEQYQRMCA